MLRDAVLAASSTSGAGIPMEILFGLLALMCGFMWRQIAVWWRRPNLLDMTASDRFKRTNLGNLLFLSGLTLCGGVVVLVDWEWLTEAQARVLVIPFIGLGLAGGVSVVTIAAFGRPRFLIPPRLRANSAKPSAYEFGFAPASVGDESAVLSRTAPVGTPVTVDRDVAELDAVIVMARPRAGWRDAGRRYKIDVDGVTEGLLPRGGSIQIHVTAGRHRVQARIDWMGSPTVDIDVPPGGQVTLEVRPNDIPDHSEAPVHYLMLRVLQ